MGLDQYLYSSTKSGQDLEKITELGYRRKHPNLHGWMEQLWLERDNTRTDRVFNGVELELTWQDIDRLEQDIMSGVIAALDTKGCFFGNPSDDYYYERDLEFCRSAKAELFLGLKVFYNSSW
jgi:hypothetical protein